MSEKKRLEYFRNTMKFTGKHKKYIDDLWEQNVIQSSYIQYLYELYGIAAILGLRLQRKEPIDASEEVRNIQVDQLLKYESVLKTIMTTVLLLDESAGRTKEERIKRAFSEPSTEEELAEDLELFNSYARGGIEFLHEELVERPLTNDDAYTDARIGNIVALLDNPLLR